MTEREFKNGEVIFRQNEEGKSFFRILEGSVGIFGGYGTPEERKLTELGSGQSFGEMALIDFYPRSAAAVSLADNTKVQEIERNEVIEYLEANPDQVLVLMQLLSDRLRVVTEDYNDVCAVIRELQEAQKSEDTEKKITKRLREKIRKHIAARRKKRNAPDSLTAEYGNDIKAAYHTEGYDKKVQIYPKGTVICREGNTVHCMYDIYWGRVGVYTGYGTDHEELITELYPDTYFGEAGMVSDEPRSATVVALEDTTVEIIYREDLEELLRKNPYKIQQIMQHLTFRLRRLSEAYMEACEQAARLAEEQGGTRPDQA